MPETGLIEDLVAANRILANEGVLDAFGHVSVRSAPGADRFLLARSMAPALVAAADIIEFGLDGEPVGPDRRTPYLERFIHSEIYRASPSVDAVVHSHSPSVIPFGATAVPLRPIWHMSAFLGPRVPVFEIRDTAGAATDLLITDAALGAALAQKLGGHAVALMRGHGNVVVADSIKAVVFRAVYTEVNAKLVAQALQLGAGRVEFLSEGEAETATKSVGGQINRAWEMWRRQAAARG
ncbi:MAG TPA: class II aldolase/adducin family protein [Stellaceae bacterium]|nr:class II aldolase/adducin family protein [Stellaceae bacterium]